MAKIPQLISKKYLVYKNKLKIKRSSATVGLRSLQERFMHFVNQKSGFLSKWLKVLRGSDPRGLE